MKQYKIASYLKAYRNSNKISLKQFSEQSGLSTALISELERGIGNPTIKVLDIISKVIDIPISLMLEEEVNNQDLVLSKERRNSITINNSVMLYDMLIESPINSNIKMYASTIQPQSQSNPNFSYHYLNEEIVYVVEGEVRVVFENEVILLKEEDTLRILPGRGHIIQNVTNKEAKVIFVQAS